MKFIPYGSQLIDRKDKELVLRSLSNELITTGPFVEKFESSLKNILNVNIVMFAAVEQLLSI